VANHPKYQEFTLINFKASREWRERAHARAREVDMSLTDYLKALVEVEIDNDLFST